MQAHFMGSVIVSKSAMEMTAFVHIRKQTDFANFFSSFIQPTNAQWKQHNSVNDADSNIA
jgi:hypothetical protein